MFKEYSIRPEGELQRRWFKSPKIDLVVWINGESVSHFQICYDLMVMGLIEPRVIKYSTKSGLRSFSVPNDDRIAPTSKILTRNYAEESIEWVRTSIIEGEEIIPHFIRDFILEKVPLPKPNPK